MKEILYNKEKRRWIEYISMAGSLVSDIANELFRIQSSCICAGTIFRLPALLPFRRLKRSARVRNSISYSMSRLINLRLGLTASKLAKATRKAHWRITSLAQLNTGADVHLASIPRVRNNWEKT